MSFGRELKDFVAGFQAGYKMVDSKEDRDLKRARAEHFRYGLDKQRRDDESLAEADRRIAAGRGGSTNATGPVAPPEEVKKIIDANVPEEMREYAYKMAYGESKYNPAYSRGAKGAKGLFQFVPDTARQYGIAEKELDPVANTQAFVKFTMNNKAHLAKLLGREPTWGELAVAHQQGAGDKGKNVGAYALITGNGVIQGNQAGNPKNAADIARYYGFDLNSRSTPATAAAKPSAIPTPPEREPSELGDPLPQKNMPDPNATPNRSAAIDGGFTGFGEFDEPTQFAASGGAIEDPTEVSDEFAAKNNLTPQGRAELVGARKAAVSMAAQNNRPAELASNVGPQGATMDDYPLGNALDHGLKFIQQAFGMGQRPAVQGSDPQHSQKIAAFTAGAGGSEEDTQAAERAVSGGNDMPRSEVVEKTVKEVGKKFKDDPQAAGRAVGTLLQTYRQRTMVAGRKAMQQVQGGDMIGALNTLKEAYDNVPDGNTVVFEPTQDGQGYVYKQLDKNNKVIEEGPVTMQALAQQAKLAAGGMAFDSLVVRAAKPSTASPQAERAAIPSEPSAAAPAAPQAPQAAGEEPSEDGEPTQQVTAQNGAGTASDATEAPAGPAATQPAKAPAGKAYAIDDVQMETPKPFAEPPPQLYDSSGLKPDSAGGKQIAEENDRLQKAWEARKAEWDRNERARVQKQFEIERAAALQRDSDARREAGARDLATRQERAAQALSDRQDKQISAREAAAQRSAERTAAIQAEGRKGAEQIKIAGEERGAQRKYAEETEKADPMWERNRRLKAEAYPLDARADVAGGSTISMQDSADLRRAGETRRAAINYDAQPRNKSYADTEYGPRTAPVIAELNSLGEKDPQNIRRYVALADRVAQRNDTDPAMITSMIYGMITNRWADSDKPTVLRDGSVAYKGTKLAMPPDVLMTIIAENGRRAVNSARSEIQSRDKAAANRQAKRDRDVRFSKKDLDNASDLVMEGASAGTDLGYDAPARTPRFQAIPVDPARLRR